MLPQAAGCGDGVTAHVRTFLHGGARITLSIATLPGAEALPGEDRGVVWTWLRPKGSNAEVARHVRRYGGTAGAGAGRQGCGRACGSHVPTFLRCPSTTYAACSFVRSPCLSHDV
jgi:hypothetical protein